VSKTKYLSDDPHVPLLDEALMTLDTYRARSPRTSSAAATWRSSDAARIIAALPAIGLVLVTKDALAHIAAIADQLPVAPGDRERALAAISHQLHDILAAYDARTAEPTGGSGR